MPPEAPGYPEHPDPLDGWLLNQLQMDFPIIRCPWEQIGACQNLTGQEILERVIRLKNSRIIRQISPIFDTQALGYQSTLVAAKVPEHRIEQAAQVINQHPGVSHNYQRDALFNLWFTLATPPGQSLTHHLQELAQQAGLQATLPLPNLRMFRIRVQLDMSSPGIQGKKARSQEGKKPSSQEGKKASSQEGTKSHAPTVAPLTQQDKRIIRLVQDDLPLIAQPFDELCERLQMSLPQLQDWFERMKRNGVMRRFAAILRHRAAGFHANGMGVWQVPADRIEQAGQLAADCPQVSHCYQRPDCPDWPFNLYTMIHARTTQQCQAVVEQLALQLAPLGVQQHRVLYSTREFKKVRLRYFTEE